MVYIVRNVKTGDTAVLGVNGHYTLGRSRLNTILLRNQYCSKKHALIEIKDGYATISDVGSTRGTFVNKAQIHDETKLQNGDVISFGLKNCIYSFIDPQFHTVIDDSILGNTKIALHRVLNALNVSILDNYSEECTHYITKNINLDILKKTRLLDALIDQKPVVTPKFWLDMFENIHEALEIPNIYKYTPQIEETLKNKGLQHILPRKNRKELFTDKLFIFFDPALEKSLEHLIWRCGGGTMLHNNEPDFATTLAEGMEFLEAIIVTEQPIEEPTLTITFFLDKLKQFDKIVQELSHIDIYVAILKGYFGDSSEDDKKKDKRPVKRAISIFEDDHESCTKKNQPAKQPTTSKKSSIEQAIKKKYPKKNKTTSSRWIWPLKKSNTTQNQEKEKGFDTSLDMSSSDDGNNKQGKKLHENDNNDKRKDKNDRKFNTSLEMSSSSDEAGNDQEKELRRNLSNDKSHVGINSDDSEPEERPTESTSQKKSQQKKNGQYSDSQIVVLDSSSEEINLQLEEPTISQQKNFKKFQKKIVQSSVEVTVTNSSRSKELQQRLNPSTMTSHDSTKQGGIRKKPIVVVNEHPISKEKNSKLQRLNPCTSISCNSAGKSDVRKNHILTEEDTSSKEISSELNKHINPTKSRDSTKTRIVDKKGTTATTDPTSTESCSNTKEPPGPSKSPGSTQIIGARREHGINKELSSKAMGSELKNRLNPFRNVYISGKISKKQESLEKIKKISEGSSHYSTARSGISTKQMEHLEAINETQEISYNTSISNSSDSFSFQRKSKQSRPYYVFSVSDGDDDDELSESVTKKIKYESDSDETNLSSNFNPKGQRKRLKVNPFARPKSSSTPKSKQGQNIYIQHLNEIFKDVDFEPM